MQGSVNEVFQQKHFRKISSLFDSGGTKRAKPMDAKKLNLVHIFTFIVTFFKIDL